MSSYNISVAHCLLCEWSVVQKRGNVHAEWDRCFGNKLHSIKPHLGYYSVTHLSRRDAVILRRLRIGHTCVTHKYLLSGDSQPLCDEFKCSLTVNIFYWNAVV